MNELSLWLSYSLSDFILFSPDVFLRLFSRINQEWASVWPLSLICLVCVSLFIFWPNPRLQWVAEVAVGVAWILSGAGFLISYFGPINPAALWMGGLFILQGSVCIVLALYGIKSRSKNSLKSVTKTNRAIWAALLVICPWLLVWQVGTVNAFPFFAIEPHITAVMASYLTLFLFPETMRRWMAIVPLVWSIFSAITLWVFGFNLMLILSLLVLGTSLMLLTRPLIRSGQ